ncbi:peroxisomal membrane protein 11-3-like [Ananas comosus]|uniref:Peroxisomal membrane protein 11-3-like n=1 Tax=Ananas comosus TaxID=4615 RepID=A0A6P5GQW9_ANACO|nr:peroxisomal membrane protein 11-3-like [Ananas comosus]
MADQSQSSPNPKPLPPPPPPPRAAAAAAERDFLLHLEAYLARRDGVDKLLKIARYAAKIALSSPSGAGTLAPRLKAFESSVGLSRKAFRLGKFVQDVNALRCPSAAAPSAADRLLAAAAYGGEGLYYFVEQFVWLAKAGLIPAELAPRLQRISAWAELVGYAGSIALKLKEVKKIRSTIESKTPISKSGKCDGIEEEEEEMKRLREKLLLKHLSIVQDLADGLMALGDVREAKGFLASPLLMASAGLLSALISTHKNWIAC